MIDVLRDSPVFQGLAEARLEQIAVICERQRFRAGALIFAENAPADTCHIVEHGEVSTQFMRPAGKPVTVRTIGRAGVFGWQCLLGCKRYVATAVCDTDVTILAIKEADIRKVLNQDERMAFRFMASLARLVGFRLKAMKARLVAEIGKST